MTTTAYHESRLSEIDATLRGVPDDVAAITAPGLVLERKRIRDALDAAAKEREALSRARDERETLRARAEALPAKIAQFHAEALDAGQPLEEATIAFLKAMATVGALADTAAQLRSEGGPVGIGVPDLAGLLGVTPGHLARAQYAAGLLQMQDQ